MDLDKLKKKLSQNQYIAVLEFIAKGDFSLEKLQYLETKSLEKIKNLEENIINLDKLLSGIQISALAKINRVEESKRSARQDYMIQEYTIQDLQKTNEDFRLIHQDFIVEEQQYLEMIREIKDIFIDLFPQSTSCPSSPRSQLEASPFRFVKSISSPNMSPRNSWGMSPRRSSSSSNKKN